MVQKDTFHFSLHISDVGVRNQYLSESEKAWNYAAAWDEVLVFWEIPPQAVRVSWIYYLDENGKMKREEIPRTTGKAISAFV